MTDPERNAVIDECIAVLQTESDFYRDEKKKADTECQDLWNMGYRGDAYWGSMVMENACRMGSKHIATDNAIGLLNLLKR